MLLLDDDRLESLRCSKCRKYLSVVPVKNHATTHDVTCGRCSKYGDGGVQSFLYELVASEYLFRCVNRYEGCGKLLRVEETEAHERLCVGGTFPCPKCMDGAERSALELQWHYRIEHPSSYLRRKNGFDVRPQTDDVKLYVRDDVFAFVSVRYGPDALHLAAATLTEVGVTQAFSVSRGDRLWERTERRPCRAIGTEDGDHYILDMDPAVSVEVTFDLEASMGAGMYDLSVQRSSKGRAFRVRMVADIESMFGYKLCDLGRVLLDSDGEEIDLNCSNCKHLIGLPIYRCREADHQICYDCSEWCGICDCYVLRSNSSQVLEKVSTHLKFLCRWKCGAYFTHDLRKHELCCQSRIFKCPNCSFVSSWSSLTLIKDHLNTDHRILNFMGDYDSRQVREFVQGKEGELKFVKNDVFCYLRWSKNYKGKYNFNFDVCGNEPNRQMALIQWTNRTKYSSSIRDINCSLDLINYSPYINFNYNTSQVTYFA